MPAQVTTGVLGKPSQEQQIRTLEGVPSSPLGDISIPSLDASDVVNYLLGGVPAVVQGLGPIFNSESNNGNDNRRSRYISVDTKRAVDKAATDESGTLRCRYCGAELSPKSGSGKSREFDHMNPFARGGSSDASNIAAACRDCNRQKGARTPEEWGGPQ